MEESMGRTDFSTFIPSLAPESNDPELDRLLSPARHYKHPDDVLKDGAIGLAEKRAILSAWASDACAVQSLPPLRRVSGAQQPVSFDAIMDALQRLDTLGSTTGDMDAARQHRLDA
jgi:hypothetical protein